ncbi:MAG: regulatory iron-sulfur-containing complex subunit RicT, partial [bacterium]
HADGAVPGVAVPHLIEIAFKGNRKEFFLWESDDIPPRTAAVIVDADRGEDLGRVVAVGAEAELRSAKVPHGLFGASATRVVKRLATDDELRRLEEIRASDDEARRKAMERVKANALVMKMTDAEWQWDRKKLTFYFTAEKRVDFRTLVRELASMFRTRIELKQIGVRDEAKRLDGIGRCGRQYCSASWLPELRPVNLGVAKDQRLSLNPSQISGACGRLMCCLRYEHEFYVASRRKYPKELKTIRTSKGEEKVLANDIFRERVTLRAVDGEIRTVPLVELRAEMTEAGDPLSAALEAAANDVSAPRAAHDHGDAEDAVGMDGAITEEHPVVQVRREARPQRPTRPVRPPAPAHADAASVMVPDVAVVPEAEPAVAPAETAAEGERRAQRRRGRRGGRRNRPSGGTSADGSTNGSGAPDGE